MKIIENSSSLSVNHENQDDPIILFTQFFIPDNDSRLKEIQYCLRKNNENRNIEKIYLLNEKHYSSHELGGEYEKTQQIVINKRLYFSDFFSYVRKSQVNGYIVLVNGDIFLEESSLTLLKKSDLSYEKKIMALLRYEYNNLMPKQSPLFGPRADSQDTWILHSSSLFSEKYDKIFDFALGHPGCDNKLIYLFKLLGYEVVNDPFSIITYHVHKGSFRNYGFKSPIPEPWGLLIPPNLPLMKITPALGISYKKLHQQYLNFPQVHWNDNSLLRNFIENQDDLPFIIPRVSGIENNVAIGYSLLEKQPYNQTLQRGIESLRKPMKNNAGIHLSKKEDISLYSKQYLKAFDYCKLYAGWECYGEYMKHINNSHFVLSKKEESKKMIWAYAFDIFHYIFDSPWTLALRGKRILIVSPFIKSIKEKLDTRENIYGIDLFPSCSFCFLKPPQTQGTQESNPFSRELHDFQEKVMEQIDDFDVALLSCGGYANPIASFIYEKGKSAIYVGGVLQMYFGIYGKRWIKERLDVMKLFKNEYWSRPKEEETPKGSQNIESACYW